MAKLVNGWQAEGTEYIFSTKEKAEACERRSKLGDWLEEHRAEFPLNMLQRANLVDMLLNKEFPFELVQRPKPITVKDII